MLRNKTDDRLSLNIQPRSYMNGILKKYDPSMPSLKTGKPLVRPGDDIRRSLSRALPVAVMALAALGHGVRAAGGLAVRAVISLVSLLPLEKIGLKKPEAMSRALRRGRNPLRVRREPAARMSAETGETVKNAARETVYRTERAEVLTPVQRLLGLSRTLKARVALIALGAAVAAVGVSVAAVKLSRHHYDATHASVRMELGGSAPLELEATQATVSELLNAYDIHVGEQDQVYPPPETPLSDGMVISISRGMKVDIYTADADHQVYMVDGTVEQALSIAGVAYDEDDVIQPALETPVEDGMEIMMIRVDNRIIQSTDYLEYTTIYKDDNSLYVGQTQVEREGQKGVQEKEVRITYMDDREMSRETIRDEVVKDPVSEIILQGTKVRATAKPTAKPTAKTTAKATTKATAKPTATPKPATTTTTTETTGHTSSNSADYVIPSAPASYVKILQMEATAYTHTGNRTATGTWPRDTRTLSNPGTIAVASDVIPYGTLLYVPGYGYGVAEDTGGFRYNNSMQIDLFMGTLQECLSWGRKRNLDIYIVQYDYR